MKIFNKVQTLLNDLRDIIQDRQYHVACTICSWEMHNLDHERFAIGRGRMHFIHAHDEVWPSPPGYTGIYEVTFTRA